MAGEDRFGDDVKMFASIMFEAIEKDMLDTGYIPGEGYEFEYDGRMKNTLSVAIFNNDGKEVLSVNIALKNIRCPEDIGRAIIEKFKVEFDNMQKMLSSYYK